MSEATTGVAVANASTSTRPKLSPPSAGDTNSFAAASSGPHLVRDDAEHVDAVVVEPQARVQQAVLQRVGADQTQPRAVRRWISGHARSSTGSPLRASWRPMKTTWCSRSAGVRVLGDDDTVRHDLERRRAASALPTRAAIGDTAMRASTRSTRNPQTAAPAASSRGRRRRATCATIGHCAKRERRDADRGRHRLVQVDDVEPLLAQHLADAPDRARREHDVR